MASAPIPACANALLPRASASSAARDPLTSADQNSRTAGRPRSAASDRVSPFEILEREVRGRKRLVEPRVVRWGGRLRRDRRHLHGGLWRNGLLFDDASLDETQPRVHGHVGEDPACGPRAIRPSASGRAGSSPGRRAAPSSAARGTPSRPARSSSGGAARSRRSRVRRSHRGCSPAPARRMASEACPPRSRSGTREAAAPDAPPSPRGPGRRHDRCRARRTIGRPDRGRARLLPRPRRSPPWPSLRRNTLRWRLAIEPWIRSWLIARHASSYGVPLTRVSGERATTCRQKKPSRSSRLLPPPPRAETRHASARPCASACR